jgi:hypothetical protein
LLGVFLSLSLFLLLSFSFSFSLIFSPLIGIVYSKQSLSMMKLFRFKVEPPAEKQNDQEFLKTWIRSVKTPIQLRVLNVLRSWVEKHFRDFYQDPELLAKLRNFLKNEVSSETMQRIASQILRQTELVTTASLSMTNFVCVI